MVENLILARTARGRPCSGAGIPSGRTARSATRSLDTRMTRALILSLSCATVCCGCGDTAPARYPVRSLCFSADGKLLAAGGGNNKDRGRFSQAGHGELTVWDCGAWAPLLETREGYTAPVTAVAFEEKPKVITISREINPRSDQGNPHLGVAIRTWTVTDKTCVVKRVAHRPDTVAISHDGKRLAYAAVWERIVITEEATQKEVAEFEFPRRPKVQFPHGDSQFAILLAFSPDDEQLLVLTWDSERLRRGYLVQASSGQLAGRVAPADAAPQLLAFTPDGRHIAAICDDGKLYLLSRDLQQVALTIPGAFSSAPALAFSGDSKFVAVKTAPGQAELFDLGTGAKLRTFATKPGDEINCLAFSPAGSLAAGGSRAGTSGRREGRVQIFDVKTGSAVAELD